MLLILLISFPCVAITAPLEIRPILDQIAQVEEGKKLLEKHDDIDITFRENTQFEAQWVAEMRTIQLAARNRKRPHNILRSILFEIHNAETTAKLESLHRLGRAKRLSKAEYVKECERIEFNNVLATMNILDKGIEQGIFHPAVRWRMPTNFRSYYSVQYKAGHCQFHAANYDRMSMASP